MSGCQRRQGNGGEFTRASIPQPLTAEHTEASSNHCGAGLNRLRLEVEKVHKADAKRPRSDNGKGRPKESLKLVWSLEYTFYTGVGPSVLLLELTFGIFHCPPAPPPNPLPLRPGLFVCTSVLLLACKRVSLLQPRTQNVLSLTGRREYFLFVLFFETL